MQDPEAEKVVQTRPARILGRHGCVGPRRTNAGWFALLLMCPTGGWRSCPDLSLCNAAHHVRPIQSTASLLSLLVELVGDVPGAEVDDYRFVK